MRNCQVALIFAPTVVRPSQLGQGAPNKSSNSKAVSFALAEDATNSADDEGKSSCAIDTKQSSSLSLCDSNYQGVGGSQRAVEEKHKKRLHKSEEKGHLGISSKSHG